jgi:hypothetical protein
MATDKSLIPNTFQHPNAYVDWLAYYLTPEEEKVLNKAIREILGWHNRIESRQARIALSVFEHGKVSKETGERLCMGCGLGLGAIRKSLKMLDEYKILVKMGDANSDGQMYRIQDNYQQVDLAGLKARRELWDQRSAARTAAATKRLAEKRAQQGVSSDDMGGVSCHDGGGVSSDDNKETQRETQKETQISPPSSGEKLPQEPIREAILSLMDFHGCEEETAIAHYLRKHPKTTSAQAIEQLQSIAGVDPLSGALKAKETASEKPATIPAAAGGADPWEKVADMFCGLHGLRLDDLSPSDRRNWPRKLESIAEGQRVTPAQMIEAIRTIPEPQSGIDWKVTGSYSSPYSKTFVGDIKILLAKIATGQIEPKGAPQPAVSPLAKAGYDVEAIRKAAERMAADD